MRRELAEAAKLNSGGLDKGGMWWLAEQMAAEEEPEAAPRPPKQVGAAAAPPAIFQANDSVWAALRPGDVMVRLGVTAAKVEELGITKDKAFVDLAQLDSFTLSGRPFAMVEGPNGIAQLESPIAGVVAARNEAIIETPGLLARNAECVDDAWLVEVDGDADELEDLPARSPT